MADRTINRTVRLYIDGREVENSAKSIRAELRRLRAEQNKMVIGSDEYVEHGKKIRQLNSILTEHNKQLKEVGTSAKENTKQLGFMGTAAASFIGNLASDKIQQFIADMKSIVDEGIEMAEKADGMKRAFDKLNQPTLLDNLRKATHGTISDLNLMQYALTAKSLNVNLETLGTLLAFAQQRAAEMGQSVDYMADSIITGLGRQSLLILDNLGLSAAEIRDNMKDGSDMAQAVAKIIDKDAAAAGEHYASAAEISARRTAELANAQEKLGEELLPIKDKADEMFTEMKIGSAEAIIWATKHKEIILAVTAALVTFTVAVNANTIATKAMAAAQALANTVTKANPYVMVAAALAALTAGVLAYNAAAGEQVDVNQELNKLQKQAIVNSKKEATEVESLMKIARDKTKSDAIRMAAIEKLNKISPEYLGNLRLENINSQEASNAVTNYTKSLILNAQAMAIRAKIEELEKKKLDLNNKAYKTNGDELLGYFEKIRNSVQTLMSTGTLHGWYEETSFDQKARKARQADLDYLNNQISQYGTALEKIVSEENKLSAHKIVAPTTKVDTTTNTKSTKYTPKVDKKETEEEKKAKEEAERIKKAMAEIALNYQQERTNIMRLWNEGQITDKKEYDSLMLDAERQYIDEQLQIVGLGKEKRMELEQKAQENLKEYIDRCQEEDLQAKKEYEEQQNEIEEQENDRKLAKNEEYWIATQDLVVNASGAIGEVIGKAMSGQSAGWHDFLKGMLITLIDFLEKVTLASVAERTVKNVGTLGFLGIAKAAAEAALIKAAFAAVKGIANGFEQGGFTADGEHDQVQGVVHSNEFVANRRAVKNESIRPVLNLIDSAQKSGTVQNLTPQDVIGVYQGRPGTQATKNTDNGASLALMAQLSVTISRLESRLSQPITAVTYATGNGGVNQAQDLVSKMEKNVSR